MFAAMKVTTVKLIYSIRFFIITVDFVDLAICINDTSPTLQAYINFISLRNIFEPLLRLYEIIIGRCFTGYGDCIYW